jgi:D-inositol-3-phosphate glycosyltransferase
MAKILLAGVYAEGTGLTRVLSKIATHLRRAHTVTMLGFASSNQFKDVDAEVDGMRCLVRHGPGRLLRADPEWLYELMRTDPPMVALVHGPALLTGVLLTQLQAYRDRLRIVWYLPIEGQAAGAALLERLAMTDHCILYTETSRSDIEALVDLAKLSMPHNRPPRLSILGHGLDPRVFYQLTAASDAARRLSARRIAFPNQTEFHKGFLILNANRPYFRKRLDLTVNGFAKFAAARPDARLVLHTGARSPAVDLELRRLIDLSGMPDRILLSPADPRGAPLSSAELNVLYNACDIGISTAMGEGWGLTPFEHAATGAAQIVPDHTSFRENWYDAAILLSCNESQFIFYESANMFGTTVAAVNDALIALYESPALCAMMQARALQRAGEPRFRWSEFGKTLEDIIQCEIANHISSIDYLS